MPRIIQNDKPALMGENLFKQAGGTSILKDVSLCVEPGKISCLIGPSGGGKSTVINCLALLNPPSEGTVSINGQAFSFNKDKGSVKGFPYPQVTVVFQGLFLWPHLTNEQNILLPLKELKKPLDTLQELAGRLGISSILKKYPNECSGGEKQRVALTRQILLEPEYLLLDEVTSALDLETVSAVTGILLDLKKKGTGILLVTHMINWARIISDDFYFLDKGVIIESGSIAALNQPKTERLNKFLQIYS